MMTRRADMMAGSVRRAPQADDRGVSRSTRFVGYAAVVWCLGFAAVNAREIVNGPGSGHGLRAYAPGLAVMSALVLVLKALGAYVAWASVRAAPKRRNLWLLAAALWGAAGVLALYSAGNLLITAATVGGLVAPSAAWESAGGVTARAILYAAFFLIGAGLFGMLAVSFQHRYHPRLTAALSGILGAPLLLGSVLVVAPRILASLGLFPS